MPLYVSLAFKYYPEDKLVSFANTVYERMSNNAVYISLKTFVDDISTKKAALTTGISLALRRDTDRITEKNVFKAELIRTLEKVARRLEVLAEDNNDDARIITDSGFELRMTTGAKSEKNAVTTVATPVVKAVNLEMAGYAQIKWKKVLNAINYAIRYKKKSDTVWQNGIHSDDLEYTFTNLESDTVYEFEVCALGSGSISSSWTASVPVYVS